MLWVPLPPERRTALICVLGAFLSDTTAMEGSAMKPAQKRFDAAGVSGRVDSDRLLDFHQLRRQYAQPRGRRKRNHGQQVEFAGARAKSVFISPHAGQKAAQYFRTEAEKARVALSLAGHVIAFACL